MLRVNLFKGIVLVCLLVSMSSVIAETEIERDILQSLTAKIVSMQAKIDRLEKSETDLKQSVSTLVGTTAQFRRQITDLNEKVSAYEKEKYERINHLENALSKRELKQCVDTKQQEGSRDQTDEEQAKGIKKTLAKKGSLPTPDFVAFFAYLNHLERNLGRGIFRVPVAGLYLFSWSVTARKLRESQPMMFGTHVCKRCTHDENVLRVAAIAETQSDTDDNQGSNTVVLQLKQGDEVWIGHYGSNDIYGNEGGSTTSFTGVLLYKD